MKMKLFFTSIAVTFFVGLSAFAADFSIENGWKNSVLKAVAQKGGSLDFVGGKVVVKHPDLETRKYDIQINKSTMLEVGSKYKLQLTIDSDAPAVVEVVYGTRLPPYQTYCRTWIKVNSGKHDYETLLDIQKFKGEFKTDKAHTLRLYFGANKKMDMTVSNFALERQSELLISKKWKLFPKVKSPADFSEIPDSLLSSSGKKVSAKQVELVDNSFDLGAMSKGSFNEGDIAVFYNEFSSDKSKDMRIGFAADWWMEIYMNGDKVYSTLKTGNKSNDFVTTDHIINLKVKKGKNLLAVKVLSGSKGWRFVCGEPVVNRTVEPPRGTLKFTEGDDWKPVDLSSLQVKDGTILDLSPMSDVPAGKHGRVIVNSKGELAFANDADKSIRLRGFNGVPRTVWQYNSEEVFEERARLFAKSARKQGYYLLRTNMLDCSLCYEVDKDMQISPKFLRRWDFLLAQLKQEGVYVHLVLASYGLYYSPFSFKSKVFKERNEHKLKMVMGDEEDRKHWQYGVETLLNHVNPYTGMKWRDDPAIAVVELYNEQENGPRHLPETIAKKPEIRKLVEGKWRSWFAAKFNKNLPKALERELKGMDLDKLPVPNMRGDYPELANQFSLFIGDMERASFNWMENIVRKSGYPGLVTQYNFSKKLLYSSLRWEKSQVIETNGYFCHPHNDIVRQDSSIAKSADYWRSINTTKLSGRPLVVTEFNHSFWNAYQYEAGLVSGAYSALQGYASIMIHSGPVTLKYEKNPIKTFTCGSSPVIRANEFLVACLFQRGDVKKALHNVELQIPDKFLMVDKNSNKPVNSEQTKLTLMTGFSLAFPEHAKPAGIPAETVAPAAVIPPAGGGTITGGEWATNVIDSKDGSFSLKDTVKQMKASGILPGANISNPDQGIYQSDTGEITMYSKENLLKIITGRTEAVCLMDGKSEKLSAINVLKTTTPATVAVCSMDGKNLSDSSSMVLVYNTAMANEGMELSYDREKMVKPGIAKPLMQTGELALTLKNSIKAKLYALRLDGTRDEEIPVQYVDGQIRIAIDTKKLKNGPTPFFELTVK